VQPRVMRSKSIDIVPRIFFISFSMFSVLLIFSL
jgi:hypothetical protein